IPGAPQPNAPRALEEVLRRRFRHRLDRVFPDEVATLDGARLEENRSRDVTRRHLLNLLAARHELAVRRHQKRRENAAAAIDDELRLHPVQLSASCSRAGSIVTGLPLAKTRSVRFAPM